jgi:dipeptidyl aminopeptidase/acylaminoacyl peptidase
MLDSCLRRSAVALLLFLSPALYAQAKRGMAIDDLNKLLRVGRPAISPDGAWIAYSVSHVDTEDDKSVSELWMVSWDGKQDIQLTYGKESAGAPRWSPDGKFLSFTSSRPGKAKGEQVWMMDRRGGEAWQATDVKQDLEDYRWSPDAKQLLLTLRERDEPESDDKDSKPKPPKPIVLDRFHFKQDVEGYLTDKHAHLFLFDIASKQLKKLTTDEKYEELDAEWSPNGEQVAFVSNHTVPDPDRSLNSDIFVVDAKPGSATRQLTTFTGDDSGPLAWSPDSKSIAFREGIAATYSMYDLPRLAIVPAAGGAVTLLAEKLDRIITPPLFTADGKALLTTIEDDRIQYVAEVPLNGGAPKPLTSREGAAIDIDAAAGHIVLQYNNDTVPTELYAVESGSIRPLTSHNQALIAQLELLPAKDLSAKSKDGTEVHSLLTMPLGYVAGTKVPMLLRIHGGPVGQDAHEFEPERQLFAAHGYAVLNVN